MEKCERDRGDRHIEDRKREDRSREDIKREDQMGEDRKRKGIKMGIDDIAIEIEKTPM